MTATWTDRYKERERVNETAAAQASPNQPDATGRPSRNSLPGVPVFAAVPFEWHDDKEDGRPDRFVTTTDGDLDLAGRPMRQGS